MSVVSTPSRIQRLVLNHKEIASLIRSHPDCPREISYRVDRLLLEAESIRSFYLR